MTGNTTTVVPPGYTSMTITPFSLPSSVSTTTDMSAPADVPILIIELGREYRIRRNPSPVPGNQPAPDQHSVDLIPRPVQKYITKAMRSLEAFDIQQD